MKKIICWMNGHEYPPYYEAPCDRCGHHYEYAESTGIFSEIRWWWYWKTWRPISNWFGKCEDCGKRFGRHDDKVDHIPF